MIFRKLLLVLALFLFGAGPALAAGGVHHDPLPPYAEEIFHIGPFVVTNSMLMMWIVTAIIVVFAQLATRKATLIPAGLQNFAEWLIESLYDFLTGLMGKDLTKKTFWFFGGIFILILISNWAGLVPGVGTVGREVVNPNDATDQFRPFLRGGNADLNMTMAMSFTFAILWFYWAVKENGLKGFFEHIFAPKGTFAGVMKIIMLIVFFAVGVLEMVSIAFRPVALSFRLFGNVYAGETLLEKMQLLVPEWLGWLPPLPFYFLELLVGLIQALVFTMLTAVFLKLICDHDHEHHDEEHSEAH